MRKFLPAVALALALPAAVEAATVTTYCPGSAETFVRDFSITIEGPVAAGCITSGVGNTDTPAGEAIILPAVAPAILLDKAEVPDAPSSVPGVVLEVTGLGALSGAWSILIPSGFSLTNAFLALKSGEGGGDPDWALFSIPTGILAGAWGIEDPSCAAVDPARGCGGTQSLSHISLYGTLVRDVAPVPLPAAGWALLTALGGMGLMARRRRG